MQTFNKQERLVNKILINQVFEQGKSFFLQPFKVLFHAHNLPADYPVQLMICVSNRNLPKATDRNKVKRLIREAYRKNKINLYNALHANERWALVLIYNSTNILSYQEIEAKIILILQRLVKEYEKASR